VDLDQPVPVLARPRLHGMFLHLETEAVLSLAVR
jgi:hypothetical protein